MPVIRLPDGTPVEFPPGVDLDYARRMISAQLAGKHGIPADAATKGSNIASAAVSGGANVLNLFPGIVSLFGADYEKAPLAGTVKSMRKYAQELESPEVTYKKALIDRAIDEASKTGGATGEVVETLKQLAVNPKITALKLAELIPDILASIATGGGAAIATRGIAGLAGKKASEAAVRKAATTAAVSQGALQEGTSTGQQVYEEVLRLELKKGTPPEQAKEIASTRARLATLAQTGVSGTLGAVLPGAEKAILNKANLGTGKTSLRAVTAGEAAEEGIQGLTGQLTQNVAARATDEEIALSRGLGRAGAEGAVLGALAGAGTGVFTRSGAEPAAAGTGKKDPVVDAAVQTGVVTPEEANEAEAINEIAAIRAKQKAAAEAAEAEEAKAAEAEKKAAEEDKLPDEIETAAPVVPPAVATTPTETQTGQTVEGPAVTEDAEVVTPTAETPTTDGTQTPQAQQTEAQGQKAPAAGVPAATPGATPTEVDQNVPPGTDVSGTGTRVPVAGEPVGGAGTGGIEAPKPPAVAETGVGTGEPPVGTGGEQPALTPKGEGWIVTGGEKPNIPKPKRVRIKKPAVEKKEPSEKPVKEPITEEDIKARWEDDADGDNHIPYENLPDYAKKLIREANEGGYYNTPFHDDLIIKVRKQERTERANKKAKESRPVEDGSEPTGDATKLPPVEKGQKVVRPMTGMVGGSKIAPKPTYEKDLRAAMFEGRLSDAIDAIAAGSANSNHRQVAKLVKKNGVKNIGLITVEPNKTYPGGLPPTLKQSYGVATIDRNNKKVTIHLNDAIGGVSEETLLHEAVHAVLLQRYDMFQYYLNNPELQGKKADPALKLYKEVYMEFRQLAEQEMAAARAAGAQRRGAAGEFKVPYWIRNPYDSPDEFITYALTEPEFQKWLESKRYKGTTLWGKFKEFVKEALGIPGTNPSWLDAALKVSTDVLEFSAQDAPDFSTTDKLLSLVNERRSQKGLSSALSSEKTEPAKPKYITVGGKQVEIESKTEEPKKAAAKRDKSEAQKQREAANVERAKNVIDVPMGLLDKTVRNFQNAQRKILLLGEAIRKRGALTPDLDLNTEITLQGGRSAAIARREIQPFIDQIQQKLLDLSKVSGQSLESVLAQLDRYMLALNEPERRVSKFYERAKLTDEGERRRNLLFRAIVANETEIKKLKKDAVAADMDLIGMIPDTVTDADARKLYKKLQEIVLNDPEGMKENIDSSKFRVVGFRADDGSEMEMTSQISDTIRNEVKAYLKQNPEVSKIYDDILNTQRKLDAKTVELNRQAGYGSPQLGRLIAARNWKNYVPMRGAPAQDKNETSYDYYGDEPAVSGLMVQQEIATKGRASAAENVIHRSFAEGMRAATRPPRTNVTQVIRNLVDKGYVKGSINGSDKTKKEPAPSTFMERFIDNKQLPRDDNVVYHYKDNGEVDIIRIDDKDLARAIRETYQRSNPVIDTLNSFTSAMGQMFTRYNPPFWIKNFLSDVLTNSFVFAAEHGKGSRYIWQVVSDLVDNRLATKGVNFIRLYEKGDFKTIEKFAETDSWYKDALDYINAGGRISYVSGLSTKKQEEATYKALGPNRIVRTKEQLDRIITPLTDGLELAARVSAFRTVRQVPEYKDNPRGAIAYSKNLANFENIGTLGKYMGAWFMFSRPSATGGVRALDALMKGKHGKRTAILAMAGGFFMYQMAKALSGDDEEGRNRVLTDDPDRWVRQWRLFVPGFKEPFQSPWGFGMGTLGSIGAQIGMLLDGVTTFGKFLSNARSAGFEGFLPVPFSQINLFEHPTQWLMDSLTPSVLRPVGQFAFNVDSLNREIFNTGFNRYSPMLNVKENVPESVNVFSKALFGAYTEFTGSPPSGELQKLLSPTGINFIMSNYLSAIYNVAGNVDNTLRFAMFDGQKEPDFIKSTMLLKSFQGTSSNYDYRKFKDLEDEVNGYRQVIDSLKKRDTEEALDKYLDKYPNHETAVKVFNKRSNGELRKLRQEQGEITREYAKDPGKRKELLEENRREQNAVMRDIMSEVREILAER
jgi:hypothetical protein